MPTDPADPSSPKPSTNLYQTTSDAPRGGGGIFFVVLLLLLLGGAAAYYFLLYKPTAATAAAVSPNATVAPVASATPAATAKPDTSGNPTYTAAQRGQYVKQAEAAYLAVAEPKRQAFADSFKALVAAGAFSPVGLTSKDAIAARRNLVAQCQKANADYEEFIKTEEPAYKAELQKTPLVPNDVNNVFEDFVFKAQTAKNVQLRDLQRASFETGDELLAYLDKTYGNWSIKVDRLSFKPGASGPFNAIGKKYNDQATAIANLQNEIKTIVDPNGTPSGAVPASPAAAGPAPSPSVAPAPNANP